MSADTNTTNLAHVAVIIPALDEEENLAVLLPGLRSLAPGQILVCDNGSTDGTRGVTESLGAQCVNAPQRGYGAACWAGMQAISPSIRIVLFMDADQADDVDLIASLLDPIERGVADLVIGARPPALREPGSTTRAQRLGNWLAPALVRLGWGHRYTDMGPFRAIARPALDAIDMQDRAYGWTIEMQIRAVELRLRIREVAVPHRRRRLGRDKIAGTWKGAALAGYWILRTCATLWWTRRRRSRAPSMSTECHSSAEP